MTPYTVMWFSAGASSAVAAKLAVDEIDEILYIHIDDQHSDTLRFLKECEEWIGKPIQILQHNEYKTVDALNEKTRFMSSVHGAKCTGVLKKKVREDWERANADKYPFRYVWGFDAGEQLRIDRVVSTQPEFTHLFPLRDKRIHKIEVHQILKASGISRPEMYHLGFRNNNCIGCLKSSSPAYWNLIRKHFPDIFEIRRQREEDLGCKLLERTESGEKVRFTLTDLDPSEGAGMPPIVEDCGILCEVMSLNNTTKGTA